MITGKSENHRDVTWKFLPRAEYACPQALSLPPKYLTRPSPASHFSRSKKSLYRNLRNVFFSPLSGSLSSEYLPHGRPLPPEKPPVSSADLSFFSSYLASFFFFFLCSCLPAQASHPTATHPICRPPEQPTREPSEKTAKK